LLPSSSPPTGIAPASRIVCQCFGVTERAVAESLAAGTGDAAERLREVQSRLHCGTSCGSCLPELRAMAGQARAVPPRKAAA
jgi:assimilatory nitrate reductase catalytic subunit